MITCNNVGKTSEQPLTMMQSYPPIVAHANELFKFRMINEAQSPGSTIESQDDTGSIPSEIDTESTISECLENGRLSSTESAEVSLIVMYFNTIHKKSEFLVAHLCILIAGIKCFLREQRQTIDTSNLQRYEIRLTSEHNVTS